MKIPTITSLITLLFILYQSLAYTQQTENWLGKNESIPYAKLYLHTDREFYFRDDSIWFKGYYLNAQTQYFIPGIFSMYVDLIDKEGKIIQNQIWPLIDGVAAGNMFIPDSTEPGNYMLRAFTDFQKGFGETSFFYKILKISKLKNSLVLAKDNPTVEEKRIPKTDIAFLPEGGFLLANQVNIVGVKALDINGKGISIQGKVLDSQGKQAAQFKTEFKGMGLFVFKPQAGEVYKVKIDGHPDYHFEFRNITEDGIKIEFIMKTKDLFLFHVITNSKLFQGKNYYFAIMNRGQVLFYKKFIQNGKETKLRIDQAILQPGINRFVLLDEKLKPISERLFFSENYKTNNIQISLNKNEFSTRSKVQLELFDKKEFSDATYSNLSVAVVNDYAVNDNGPALNILSWLLLDSELKGNIESPSDFFVDDINLTSARKLNLLMLTQGWSNYLWNALPKKDPALEFKDIEGISINGRVRRTIGKKPVKNREVFLNISKENYFYSAKKRIDETGGFSFDSIFFTDTAWVFLQARNRKGHLSTIVLLDPVFEKSPGISKQYLPKKAITDVPVKLYDQQYFSERAMKDFILKSGSVLLDEIIIPGQQKEKSDGHFRIYSKPKESFKITHMDLAYRNIFDYLQGRVAGVMIVGNSITIHGPGSFGPTKPLFLLNGIGVEEEVVRDIPMNDIDIVEVLKRPGDMAIFGTRKMLCGIVGWYFG